MSLARPPHIYLKGAIHVQMDDAEEIAHVFVTVQVCDATKVE